MEPWGQNYLPYSTVKFMTIDIVKIGLYRPLWSLANESKDFVK